MESGAISLKEIELKLLHTVDSFCTKKSITYYLGFGTLLGCVRHGGFIPWDDDVDIFMPRSDYELFIKTFVSGDAYLINNLKNKRYTYPFAKVCDKRTILKEVDNPSSDLGVYIDVFPIDGLPAEKGEQKKHLSKIYWYKELLIHKFSSLKRSRSFAKTIILSLLKILLFPFSYSFIINRISKLSTKYSYNNCEDVSCIVWGYEYKSFKKKWFGNGQKKLFEGSLFFVPEDFDSVLTSLYGDYMKLPPIEKQISNHNFVVENRTESNK